MTIRLAIDAHAHVFRRGLPLAPGRRYAPDYDAPVDHYLRNLDANGLTHGLLVQPSFLGADNAFLLDSLRRAPDRLRGVAVVDPGTGRDHLEVMDAAGIVGIRLNLMGRVLPAFDLDGWPVLLKTLAELQWHVEVQRPAADLNGIAVRLLDAGVNVVIDHFGLPDPTLGAADPGWAALLSHAPSRRLWVKLSAPYRNGPACGSLARDLFPRLRDSLGLDRLVWGSDWPHTQFEASQTYDAAYAFLNQLVADDDAVATILRSGQLLLRLP